MMLSISNLHAGYNGNDILHGIDLDVQPASIVALVGANGAGKSTTLKAVSGLIRSSNGKIVVDDTELKSGSSEKAVLAGIAHIPEGRQIFTNLTVSENLVLGAYLNRKRAKPALSDVLGIFPELKERLNSYAGSLSGGQQQMLAIGRGLMSEPRYLLLDEPSLGLAPTVVERIFQVIEQLRDQGKGILLVEQNGRIALARAQRGCLLEQGKVTMSGSGKELLENDEVIARYLGVGSDVPLDANDRARVHAIADALASTNSNVSNSSHESDPSVPLRRKQFAR